MTRRIILSSDDTTSTPTDSDSNSDYSPDETDTTVTSDKEYKPHVRMTYNTVSKGKSHYYTHTEDLSIVSYILKRGIHKVDSCDFWKEMEVKLDMNRTWKSLKDRFKRIVVEIDKQHLYPNVSRIQAIALKKLMLPEYKSPVKENKGDNMSVTSLSQKTREKVTNWLNSCPSSTTATEINQNNSGKKLENCVTLAESSGSDSDDSIRLKSSVILRSHKANLGRPTLSQTKQKRTVVRHSSSDESEEEPKKISQTKQQRTVVRHNSSDESEEEPKEISPIKQKRTVIRHSSSDKSEEEPKKISQTKQQRTVVRHSSSNESEKEQKKKSPTKQKQTVVRHSSSDESEEEPKEISQTKQQHTVVRHSSSDESEEEPKKKSPAKQKQTVVPHRSSNESKKEPRKKSQTKHKLTVVLLSSSDEDVEGPKKILRTKRKQIHSSYYSLTNAQAEEQKKMSNSEDLIHKYKKILSLSSSSSDENYTTRLNKNSPITKTSQQKTNSKIPVQESDSDDESECTIVNLTDRQISNRTRNKNRQAVKENYVFSQNRQLRSGVQSQETKLSFPVKRPKMCHTFENKRQRTDDGVLKNCENIHSSRTNKLHTQFHKPVLRDGLYNHTNTSKNCNELISDDETNQCNRHNHHSYRNYPTETRHHRTVPISENIERMELHSSPVNKYCSRGNSQFCPSTSKNNRLIETEKTCVKCNRENVQTCTRHECSPCKVRFRHDQEMEETHSWNCRGNNCENTDGRCNINCNAHCCDSVRHFNSPRSFAVSRLSFEPLENRRTDCNCSMCRKCTCVGHLNEKEHSLLTNNNMSQQSQRSTAVQTMVKETDPVLIQNRKYTNSDVQTRINKCSQTRREQKFFNTSTQNSRREKTYVRDLVENNSSPEIHTEVVKKKSKITSPKKRFRDDEWLCTQKETFSSRRERVEYKFRCLICCQLITFFHDFHKYLVVQKMSCNKCHQNHKITYKDMKIQKLEIPSQEPIIQLDDVITNKNNYKVGLKKVLNPFALKKPFSVTLLNKNNKIPKPREIIKVESLLDDELVDERVDDEQIVQRRDKNSAYLTKEMEVSKKNERQNEKIDLIQNIERNKRKETKEEGLRNRLPEEVGDRQRILYSGASSMVSLPAVQIRRNSRMANLPVVLITRDPLLDAKCKNLGKHEVRSDFCDECKSVTPERQTHKILMSPPISCEKLSESRLNQYASSEVSSAATDSSRKSKSKKKLFTQPSFEELDQILSDDNLETQRRDKSKESESSIPKPTLNVMIEKLKLIQINQACIYGRNNQSKHSTLKSSTEKTDRERNEITNVNLTSSEKEKLEVIKLNKNTVITGSPERNLQSTSKSTVNDVTVEKTKSLISVCIVPEKQNMRIEEREILTEDISLLKSPFKQKTKESIVSATSCTSQIAVDEGNKIEKMVTKDHGNISKSVTKQGIAEKQTIEIESEGQRSNENIDERRCGLISDILVEEINKELVATSGTSLREQTVIYGENERPEIEKIVTKDHSDHRSGVAEKQNIEIETEVPNEKIHGQSSGVISDVLIAEINKELEKMSTVNYPVQQEELVNAEPEEVENLLEILTEDSTDENLVPSTSKSTTEKNVSKEFGLSQFCMSIEGSIGDTGKEITELPILRSSGSIIGDNEEEIREPEVSKPDDSIVDDNGGENLDGSYPLKSSKSDLLTQDEDPSEKVDSQVVTTDGEINIEEVFSQDLRSYDF